MASPGSYGSSPPASPSLASPSPSSKSHVPLFLLLHTCWICMSCDQCASLRPFPLKPSCWGGVLFPHCYPCYMQCSKIRRRDGAVCSTLTAERSLEAALRNLKMCLAIPLPSMTGKHFSWPILALHFSRSLFSICLTVFVSHGQTLDEALCFTNWALDVLVAPCHHMSSRCLDFVHIVLGVDVSLSYIYLAFSAGLWYLPWTGECKCGRNPSGGNWHLLALILGYMSGQVTYMVFEAISTWRSHFNDLLVNRRWTFVGLRKCVWSCDLKLQRIWWMACRE